MIKLTAQDKKLLYLLESNSRKSISSLASDLRINRTTVNYKINRLEKSGLIEKYVTIIDMNKLGYMGYRIYFQFSGTNVNKETEIFEWISSQKESFLVQSCNGSTDASIILFVKKEQQLQDFLNSLKQNYRSYLNKLHICRYLKTHHYKRDYLMGEFFDYDVVSTSDFSNVACDDLDLKILHFLSLDSRMPLIELADKLNSTTKTIIHRIKNLEKRKIILGYTLLLNIQKLGLEYYKLNISLNHFKSYKSLLEYAKKIPQTVYVDETISDYDFELNLELANKSELNSLIEELKNDFSGLKGYDYFSIKKTYKLTYFDPVNL